MSGNTKSNAIGSLRTLNQRYNLGMDMKAIGDLSLGQLRKKITEIKLEKGLPLPSVGRLARDI